MDNKACSWAAIHYHFCPLRRASSHVHHLIINGCFPPHSSFLETEPSATNFVTIQNIRRKLVSLFLPFPVIPPGADLAPHLRFMYVFRHGSPSRASWGLRLWHLSSYEIVPSHQSSAQVWLDCIFLIPLKQLTLHFRCPMFPPNVPTHTRATHPAAEPIFLLEHSPATTSSSNVFPCNQYAFAPLPCHERAERLDALSPCWPSRACIRHEGKVMYVRMYTICTPLDYITYATFTGHPCRIPSSGTCFSTGSSLHRSKEKVFVVRLHPFLLHASLLDKDDH